MIPSTSTTSCNRAIRPQLIMACAFFMFLATSGLSVGHSSVLLPELKRANGTLHIDEDMESWIASLYTIVGPFGGIFGGFVIDAWGRKKVSILGSSVLFLGWVLITCAQNVPTILVGRILEGLSRIGVATSLTVLVDEASEPKYRGLIICCSVLFYSVGLITISSLAAFLHWRTASGLGALVTFLSIVVMFFIGESPMWLIRKKKKKRAENVLRYLWGPGKESQAKNELADLVKKLHLEDEAETTTIRQKIVSSFNVLAEPHVLKPFLIMHFFNVIQIFCGVHLFTYYSIDVLSKLENGAKVVDVNVANIIISILRTVTAVFTCFFIFFIGRRKLSLVSGTFSFIFSLGLGLVLLARNLTEDSLISEHVDAHITLVLLILFIVSMALGFLIFPYLMIGETQASSIRGFACGYIYAMNDLVLGGVLKLYPWLMKTLQIHGLFLMFATSCLICTIFVYLFLPETKGLALQEIEEYFRQPNILWIRRKTNLKKNTTCEERYDESKSVLLKDITSPTDIKRGDEWGDQKIMV